MCMNCQPIGAGSDDAIPDFYEAVKTGLSKDTAPPTVNYTSVCADSNPVCLTNETCKVCSIVVVPVYYLVGNVDYAPPPK